MLIRLQFWATVDLTEIMHQKFNHGQSRYWHMQMLTLIASQRTYTCTRINRFVQIHKNKSKLTFGISANADREN